MIQMMNMRSLKMKESYRMPGLFRVILIISLALGFVHCAEDGLENTGSSVISYSTATPVLTDQLILIDDPSGSWAVKRIDIDDLLTLPTGVTLSGGTLKLDSIYLNEVVALTATATELNQLDGVTVGGTSAGDIVDLNTAQTLTNKTATSIVLNTAVSGTAVLDEDAMGSDSATQVATQQSIKAYVDDTVADVLDGTTPITALDVNGNGDISGTLNIGAGTTRTVVPSGTFVNAGDGGPYVSSTQLDLEANVVESAWESVGGTSSGADNVWTAMNSVPIDADWVEIRVFQSVQDGATSTNLSSRVSARADGSSIGYAYGTIGYAAAYSDGSGDAFAANTVTAKVPVETDGSGDCDANYPCIEVYWVSTFTGTDIHEITLVGWGFNP
jgi:hypothetical protein